MVKKSLMITLWRIQQSQAIISIIFWSLTLTGIFYQYAKYYMAKYLNIPESMVLTGMGVLFLIVVIGILVLGFLFDELKFWKEQQIVAVERNPFSYYQLTPRDIIIFKELWIPILREINEINKKMGKENQEINKKIEFFEKWVNGLIKNDEKIKRGIEDALKTIENLSKK